MTSKRKQVSRACMRCKQSHSCCGTDRPCERCLSLGLGDSCKDSEQKKRGRKKKLNQEEQPQKEIKFEKVNKPNDMVWQSSFSIPDDFPIFNENALNNLIKNVEFDESSSFELELKLQGLKSIVEQQKKEIESLKKESKDLEEQQNQDKEKIISTFNANAFKCAFESSSFAMVLLSAEGDGKLLSWNGSFLKLLGYSTDLPITSLVELTDSEEWKRAQEIHFNALNNGSKSYNLKLHFRKTTGEIIMTISHNDILYDVDTKLPLFCLSIMTEKISQ